MRFSTYGVPMIAGEIRRYLRDNSAVRVSRDIRRREAEQGGEISPV